jgi:hypothetical protein
MVTETGVVFEKKGERGREGERKRETMLREGERKRETVLRERMC